MTRTILHIDFDSFFASCEQHFNPNLRGKPIGVTAANGRTCIIAASREAKEFGIKTGGRTWEAEQVCPQIQFIQSDFDRYLHITKKFVEIASSYSPVVEVFSLDEVFIDMTPTMHLYHNDHFYVVKDFKRRLIEEIGPALTVSVGISYNKLLAKLASGLNKPDGHMLISKENLEHVYRNTKLTDICGIGNRFERRLHILGIYTLMDLRKYPFRLLKKEFGLVAATNLTNYAWAQDDTPVHSFTEEEDAKSVGRQYCLPKNETDQIKIKQTLFELSYEVARRLRLINKKCRTVGLYLGGQRSCGGRKSITNYTNQGADIYKVIELFLKEWKWFEQSAEPSRSMVRQISIWTGNLIDEKYATINMFENPRVEMITKAVDMLNARFGNGTIKRGYVLKTPTLTTKPNGFFGDQSFFKDYLTPAFKE